MGVKDDMLVFRGVTAQQNYHSDSIDISENLRNMHDSHFRQKHLIGEASKNHLGQKRQEEMMVREESCQKKSVVEGWMQDKYNILILNGVEVKILKLMKKYFVGLQLFVHYNVLPWFIVVLYTDLHSHHI